MQLKRRDFLKASAALPLWASIRPATAATRSALGRWEDEADGLPAFRYLGALPFRALDKTGQDSGLPDDPMFILGNYRLTVFAHVSGVLEIMTGERAWARANASKDRINYGTHSATIALQRGDNTRSTALIGVDTLAADPARCERTFGVGYARYNYALGDGVTCTRLVSVRPSPAVHQGNPSVVITVTLHNGGSAPLSYDYREQIGNEYVTADSQRTAADQRSGRYDATVSIDRSGQLALSTNRFHAQRLTIEESASVAARNDVAPMHLFLATGPAPRGVTRLDVSPSGAAQLGGRATGSLAPGASVSVDIVIGLTSGAMSAARLQAGSILAAAQRDHAGLYRHEWRRHLPDLSAERNGLLRREMLWNAYCIEAMATYNSYFDETFIPQGQVYNYQDGENISNRDHAQALLPLVYTNPPLARSALRYLLKHTSTVGAVSRGTSGVGYTSPDIFKESDEQLYVFMAIGDYLRVTRDYSLLNDVITYFPRDSGRSATVLELLKRHFVYLRDEVGLGEHGLIKMLNSDWSDSFFHTVPVNTVLHSAESHMNSAMALAVIPTLSTALKKAGEVRAAPLIAALDAYVARLSGAFLRDLGERDFAARAYLGEGKGDFGLDTVCIEAQGFLLQMADLPNSRKARMYDRIKAALLEPVGLRVHQRPVFGGKGEGEDGAIWAALEHQVLRGVIGFDKAEAERLLELMSFATRARVYPDYWLGQWTRFDGMQSSLSEREGLLNYWFPEIFKVAFVGFCSHAHSWPLYNYMLLRRG